uniref:FIP-RBD domain-containing protein n=1 Tax=Sinocyclocheilus anshuiensis TaxID=1608454 RepID=A0A671SKI5_9TELE
MYGSARSVGKVEGNHSGGSNQSPGRSPRLPLSPHLGHRRTNSTGGSGAGAGGPGGKTLSMENIQSLNAAYATSGPMYLSDNEVVASGPDLPKSTMTLGRSGGRVPYGVRTTVMGSSPNISTGAPGSVPTDAIAFGDHHMPSTLASTVPHSLRQARDNTIMDLQAQLKEVLGENELLRKEVDVKESKLSSSMNSIKTFWSPELKKERALRKDEVSKIAVWKEQYRVIQDENQHLQMTIQALQDELRIQRDLNQLFQQDPSVRPGEPLTAELTEDNFQRLHGEHERQAKELFLLRKTLEEMELRIDTQKQTLCARDESIKKLLEMLQSKGLSAKASEEDHERTRRLADAEMHIHHLKSLLEQREKEMVLLREDLHRRFEGAPESAKTKALQTVIEMKDSKISSLERSLRDLEDEIQMLKSNGAVSTEEREEEMKQMEVYRSHSKFMKNKVEPAAHGNCNCFVLIDQVKQDLSRKDTELLGLQTKLETLTNQFSDSKQHIDVLKESLTAKEQRAAILQTEVDALRLRLEEKEAMLNKKSKQIQEVSEEKGTLNGEIHDLKDMLDVKERKVNVLQKKIENLQEQLKDKEKQMTSLKERVKSLQADTSNTDTALTTLEEALSEKERIIERLKEQRDRDEREKSEELESNKKELKELKEKVSLLQGELSDREASLLDLKEHASSLASSGLKKDSKLKSLEIALEQKREECTKFESQLKKAQSIAVEAQTNAGLSECISTLEQEVARYKEDAGKAQAEVDRLLEILREMENEKNDKDRKINELERQMKDQSKKVANLKHKEQVEKNKNAQLMEEARKREDNMNESSQQIKDSLRQKDERIEELEEALRESVQITAEREMVLAQEESARANAEKQMEELLPTMEKVKQELESMKAKLSSTQQSLAEKEAHLTTLRAERRKHLEEVLEMKQEALLAAISEKDANIALLELSSSKKKKTQDEVALLKREKDRLVHQLKQQTQNRMKLIADNYEDDHLKASNSDQTNHKPSPDQIIPPLIDLNQNRSKLKLYISHLTALCHERDPHILQNLAPPSAYHRSQQDAWEEELQKMSPEQLESELEQCERESAELQEYANSVLQQIADHCPDILEQVVNALEESC